VNPASLRVTDYLCGIGLRELVEQMGMQQARKWVNARGRNADRIWKRYAWALPFDTGERALDVLDEPAKVTPRYLYEVYRDSVSRQLAA
jgi:hypothetical protein